MLVNTKETGFTLVEIALVLVIVGLMLGGMLVPLSAQVDQRNYTQNKAQMDDIQQALLGFAMSKGYLPCPAKSFADGSEDRTSGACTTVANSVSTGYLPWGELGLPKFDPWGHVYVYTVTAAFASSTKVTLSAITTSGQITVQTRDSNGNLTNLTATSSLSPAAVLSRGKNSFYGYSFDGTQIPNTSTTNTDEQANGNGNGKTFYSRTYTDSKTTTGGEFDDVVVWLSPSIYASKMVASGQLP